MSPLFQPLALGSLNLKNRIFMAPLTRCRCEDDRRIPNELMAKYYSQRSSAGLILSEATSISTMACGYARTPGIWNDQQVAGWQKITQAVHAEGGLIFCQLWHVGRISDPTFLNGQTPVAPSAIRPSGKITRLDPNQDYVVPRSLETPEIEDIVAQYVHASRMAKEAGFDGVEVHGANGYLIEQFLRASSNKRSDHYGGTIENRIRFLLEIIDGLLDVWSADRIGVHLSPDRFQGDLFDPEVEELYRRVFQELSKRKIGFIFLREEYNETSFSKLLRNDFNGVLVVNQNLTLELASQILENKAADAVSFGRLFISNPDLPKRLRLEAKLAEFDSGTFYSEGVRGYTDYPALP
jgi:2,4-dienoyl-CoA reductase-like NADH-dependent reductase (Old Yellow Enzyme family)